MENPKTRKEKTPDFTTVRVTSDTNKKLAKAVDKYNDRHPGSTLTKDEFLSLLLDYCSNFGIDIDETEKPLTAMNKLRSSVKSFNDSAWAAKKETEKFVQEQKTRTDKIISAEKELCDTIAELVGDKNFNSQVLQPIKNDLKNLYRLTAMRTTNADGKDRDWTLSESLFEIINKLVILQLQLTMRSKNCEKNPTLLDRIEHIESMIASMKMKGRLYGWEEK